MKSRLFASFADLYVVVLGMRHRCLFLVGLLDGCTTEMRQRMIAHRYLRTWFFYDILLVGIEALLIALEAVQGKSDSNTFKDNHRNYLQVARSIRLGRVLRVLGVVRVIRLQRVAAMLMDIGKYMRNDVCIMMAKKTTKKFISSM